MISSSSRCYPFDVRGEGFVVMVVKRLVMLLSSLMYCGSIYLGSCDTSCLNKH
jgi:hypothetical protein